MSRQDTWKSETIAIALGRGEHLAGAPLNVPIIPASNFRLGGKRRYTRDDGQPGWEALEEIAGALEGGHAVSFASGMAAVTAVFESSAWEAVVLPAHCYAGVRALARERQSNGRCKAVYVDTSDASAVFEACSRGALLWLESPSNPLLEVADLPQLIAGAHARGAKVAVDNTFATPLIQKPLSMGADYVVHSATKYLSGHSDVMLGILVVGDEQLLHQARLHRVHTGSIPGALEAYLAVRGIRTLPLRFAKAQANAAILAQRLRKHAAVERTRYPEFGAIISFDVRAGAQAADDACAAIALIVHATSLGGLETSMERRGNLPGEEHLPPGLIRLSVGCEDVDDLWNDLQQALDVAAERRG